MDLSTLINSGNLINNTISISIEFNYISFNKLEYVLDVDNSWIKCEQLLYNHLISYAAIN
jgi:hypothetical protein